MFFQSNFTGIYKFKSKNLIIRTDRGVLQLLVQLGLELQCQGFLEVDRPDRLTTTDLGGLDFSTGNGEHDWPRENGNELLGNLSAWLRDSEVAPIFGRGIFLVRPFQPLINLRVLWDLDEQNILVGPDLEVDAAVDSLEEFFIVIEVVQ